MTILTLLALNGLPIARTNQLLKNDVTQLRSLISRAQQQALNEIRSPECLARAGEDPETQRRCSDVGVAIMNKKLILFADLNGDHQYSEGHDYDEAQVVQSADVVSNQAVSVLFTANPPTTIMYVNRRIIGAGQTAPLELTFGGLTAKLTISPYGILEYANQK